MAKGNEVIHKYRIDVEDDVTVSMPEGATVLHAAALETPSTTFRSLDGRPVRTVHGRLELWARIDPQAPHVDRRFAIRGTGHVLGDVGEHIGTVQDAPYVWHIFEAAP